MNSDRSAVPFLESRMKGTSTLLQIVREAMFALGRELAAWKPSSARAVFGLEAMLSVALSVVLANALHLSNTWWAAISGFAVMQTSFSGSIQRAIHRMLGTVLGALLAALLGPMIGDRPWLFVPVLGLMGGATIYFANGSKASYAWILGGITSLMTMYEAHVLVTFKATAGFATLRVAEVVVGTLACVIVASAFHFGPQWRARIFPSSETLADAPADITPPSPAPDIEPSAPALRPVRRLLAVQCAIAIVILASLTYLLKLPGFAQAMVTSVAVLLLPVTVLAQLVERPVVVRMVHRVTGCLIAGVLAIALLPLTQGNAWLCMLALAIGVWLGCHVQTGSEGASYVGRQFTIAFIMVFVQDHHWSSNPVPALMRLSGILSGILVLSLVIYATSRWRAATQVPMDAAG
jgi:uncharacterized membrane protein YccC